jgi:hypothetical protein
MYYSFWLYKYCTGHFPFCGVNCIYTMFRKAGPFVLSALITEPMIKMALSSRPKRTGNLPLLHLMMEIDYVSEMCTSCVPRKWTISNIIFIFWFNRSQTFKECQHSIQNLWWHSSSSTRDVQKWVIHRWTCQICHISILSGANPNWH